MWKVKVLLCIYISQQSNQSPFNVSQHFSIEQTFFTSYHIYFWESSVAGRIEPPMNMWGLLHLEGALRPEAEGVESVVVD